MKSAALQPCPHCQQETTSDAALCTACGGLLGRARPDAPTTERPFPMAEGVYRLEGALLEIADYLAGVIYVERGFDRRATRWALVAAGAVFGAIAIGVLGYLRDWPWWWAPPIGCAALALFSFSRFGAVSEFDLPENRLACAEALLRGLHQRGQTRGDLTLDVEHKLKAEVLAGKSPISVELKAGKEMREEQRRVQRQSWLLLDLELKQGALARFAVCDYTERVEAAYRYETKGPISERRYSSLQLLVKGGPATLRAPEKLSGYGKPWQARSDGETTTWLRLLPAHEELTKFDSDGRGTTRITAQGEEPDAKTAEILLQALDGVQSPAEG